MRYPRKHQSQVREVTVPQRNRQPVGFTKRPRALVGIAKADGVVMSHATLLEFANPGTRVLPTLPNKRAQTAPYPALKTEYKPNVVEDSEIPPPAACVQVQFVDDLGEFMTATAACDLPNAILEPSKGFGVRVSLGFTFMVYQTNSEPLAISREIDGALLFVYN